MSMGSNPVFPTILYNYNISYLINSININKIQKNLYFYIFFTRKNIYFLNFLKNFNFIHKYVLVKKNGLTFLKIYIYYYKNKSTCSTFKLLSKPSKRFLISYKALKLLHKRSGCSIYLISTSKGLLSHHDAIKNKIGGFVVGFFSF